MYLNQSTAFLMHLYKINITSAKLYSTTMLECVHNNMDLNTVIPRKNGNRHICLWQSWASCTTINKG